MNTKALCAAVLAGLALAIPAKADRVTVYRDRDHDGHYNKKTYDGHRHYRHYDRGYYYPGRVVYRNYYGPSYRYYPRPYYYRPRPTFYFGFSG